MHALLDSGAQSNYISSRAVWLAGLRPTRKTTPYPLRVANGEPMPEESEITHEVTAVPLQIHGHHEEVDPRRFWDGHSRRHIRTPMVKKAQSGYRLEESTAFTESM